MVANSSGALDFVERSDAYIQTCLTLSFLTDAARDGRLEVVQQLLAHGARPDYRNNDYHSSIRFALPHPQVLWLCENAVRKHRKLECHALNKRNLSSPALLAIDSLLPDEFPSIPPENLVITADTRTLLINAIVSADLLLLRTLLFPSSNSSSPPVLVNQPDANGWSAIHYCASSALPSIEVLDTLYRAGADVGLFSASGNSTPLHCLARKRRGSNVLKGPVVARELFEFVTHLVRDLRAPTKALAAGGETCLHVAAETGDSVDVLRALIDCDVDGSVRETRNDRGLTPLEVAKPEFRGYFGAQAESTRSSSPASFCTVRPSHLQPSSPATPTARSSTLPTPSISLPRSNSPVHSLTLSHSPGDSGPSSPDDTAASTTHLIRSLRTISHELDSSPHPLISDLDCLSSLLRSASSRSAALLSQLRTRIDEASDDLKGSQDDWREVDLLLDGVSQAYEDKVKAERRDNVDDEEGILANSNPSMPLTGRARSGTTVSSESQMTAVDHESDSYAYSTGLPPTPTTPYSNPSFASSFADDSNGDQRSFFHDDHEGGEDGPLKVPWPAWIDRFEPRSPVFLGQGVRHVSYNSHFVTSSAPPPPTTARVSTSSASGRPELKSHKSMGELRVRPKHFSLSRGATPPNVPRPSHSPSSSVGSAVQPPLQRPGTLRPRAETSASARSVKFPVSLEVPAKRERAMSATDRAAAGRDRALANGKEKERKKEKEKPSKSHRQGDAGTTTERDKSPKSGKFKAWFRKTLNLKPLAPVAELEPRTHQNIQIVQDQGAGEAETEGRSSLTTLCECEAQPAERAKRRSLSSVFPYRAFAAASKDLARMDERMANVEKLLSSAYRCVARAEKVIKKAIQAREKIIQEQRTANSVEAGLEAFLSHRDSQGHSPLLHAHSLDTDPVSFPSVSRPSSPTTTSFDFPSPPPRSPSFYQTLSQHPSADSSVSSFALTARYEQQSESASGPLEDVDVSADEDDLRRLELLLEHKAEVRIDAATDEIEKVKIWLSVTRDVIKGVQKRVGLEVSRGMGVL